MFTMCENTNLKGKNDKFGDMRVVHCIQDAAVMWHRSLSCMTSDTDTDVFERCPLKGVAFRRLTSRLH